MIRQDGKQNDTTVLILGQQGNKGLYKSDDKGTDNFIGNYPKECHISMEPFCAAAEREYRKL